MLAAVLAVALSQWGPEPSPGMQQYDPGSVCQRTGGRCFLNRSGNRPRENYAFFEFAPASGAGMGTACACTTPTGAKGEAMTFARTGDATCSKQGLATTGIANGDLVVCTANQPRVESSGGVLGLRVEGARTNVLPRSSELDNAAWVLDFSGGGVVPTRTANAAVAPDGTTSGERLQFSACPTAGDASLFYQLHATSGASASTIFCRGNGSTQTISVCSFGSTGSSGCTPVSCPSTSWSRVQDLRTATGTGGLVVGCNNLATYAGGSNTGAADVFLWGAQQEMGATFATSYIPTTSAAVTRNAETAIATISAGLSQSQGSAAITFTPLWSTATPTLFRLLEFDSSGRVAYSNTGNGVNIFDGTNDIGNTWTLSVGTPVRVWGSWAGATLSINDGTDTATGAFDGTFGAGALTSLSLGYGASGPGQANGIITRVCVDPDPTRCR